MNGDFLIKNTIEIKFEHLRPEVQDLICQKFFKEAFSVSSKTIRQARTRKQKAGSVSLVSAGVAAADFFWGEKDSNLVKEAGMISLATLALREHHTKELKLLYSELAKVIQEKGLIHPKFSKEYSETLRDIKKLTELFPSFHVQGDSLFKNRKNIVFHKITNWEYFRLKYQQTFNCSAWRWRQKIGELKPSNKVQKWTEKQLNKIIKARQNLKKLKSSLPKIKLKKKNKPPRKGLLGRKFKPKLV